MGQRESCPAGAISHPLKHGPFPCTDTRLQLAATFFLSVLTIVFALQVYRNTLSLCWLQRSVSLSEGKWNNVDISSEENLIYNVPGAITAFVLRTRSLDSFTSWCVALLH